MSNDAILRKLNRLQSGAKPRVLDLFAGCGGISLGFEAAGFEMRASVEFDPDAARSHGVNFHNGAEAHSQPIDITKTSPADLCGQLTLGSTSDAFDIVVGGPPCQAFARVGRSKLREIEEHPEAFIHDPRAQLYKKYLEYVDTFQPLAVLMENVPDILNHGGQNIAEETCEVLAAKGYVCRYTLLNAAFYGVPQMRERMFLIAYRHELGAAVSFPSPTHWLVLPPGYGGSRSVALKTLSNLADQAHSYVTPPVATRDLPPAVTAEDALADLPAINARELLAAGKIARGARRFDTPIRYSRKKPSAYAELMRTWPGHEAPEAGLTDHVIRYLPRDYELFARMNPGDQYPQAHAHAVEMFQEKLAAARIRGEKLAKDSSSYKALWDSIVPPYDASKFPNKWRKMWRDQPARTLMAHLGKDSYSHIHYDSKQARTISVREAARLQSFPDGFRFSGTMNPAFKQIGNAVPPLMAKALAIHMMQTIRQAIIQKEAADEPRRAAATIS
ncbi:DNA cytosine methyltransferase [Xanthomonas translucens]|uniref:DNA cytosine methyltransferase n=1 Tax=Xanthomonas campestris pv. translucens TaxID=343 RepID=UPI0009C082E9|nr:DNA cytosine methyltransferase [Xanthomonas translucens]QSQ52105.1 DNA cytosine methyltransferase [Xanthomonas translucens pv. undulosa]QSQ58977.1 DNA cytosine methyltransferase [Xanthomonas translucens pv. undulosa]UPU49873.1 DNA cytosine methyltransferase [Xanthomonas translucens pv. undulosa]